MQQQEQFVIEVRVLNVPDHGGSTDNELKLAMQRATDPRETMGIGRIRLAGFGSRLIGRSNPSGDTDLPPKYGRAFFTCNNVRANANVVEVLNMARIRLRHDERPLEFEIENMAGLYGSTMIESVVDAVSDQSWYMIKRGNKLATLGCKIIVPTKYKDDEAV